MPTISHGIFRWMFWRGASLENFADRLNHFWTFGLLLLLACIISWKHSYTKPITCWVPEQFTSSMQHYTEETCWYQKLTFYPHITHDVPKSMEREDMPRTRSLYQWLPIILCFQALLFKLPNLLMYILHGYSGMSFEKVACLTSGFENMSMQERDILSKQTARYIYNWCKQFKNLLPWRLLTVLWLVVKILYCLNIIVQISLVDTFLMSGHPKITNTVSYGDVIRRNLFSNNASLWEESPAFPRLTFCSFQIRKFAKLDRYTIQCALHGNNFNEFVYMFLWVWFVFVAMATCLSLIIWTLRTIIPIFRKQYIKKLMELVDEPGFTAIQPNDLDKFCEVIGEDGVMVLKLIAANSSEVLAGNVIYHMWTMRMRGRSPQQAAQIISLPQREAQPLISIQQASGTTQSAKVV